MLLSWRNNQSLCCLEISTQNRTGMFRNYGGWGGGIDGFHPPPPYFPSLTRESNNIQQCLVLKSYMAVHKYRAPVVSHGLVNIWLGAKWCTQRGGGGGGLAINKISFKHFVMLLYVCIHDWSLSQWKQWLYEFQIWNSWAIFIFWKEKRATEFDSWKRTRSRWVLSMLSIT